MSAPGTELRRLPWTYAELDRRQREIAARVREGGEGALLLSEVAPVITMGRRAGDGELRADREWLAARGISVYPTKRGGLATYHGPGQWVVFAVDSLERLTGDRRGVRKAVEGLLVAAREVGERRLGRAEIREGCELGVWGPGGKFAAVGVHVEQGVLQHGLAINGFRTATSFVGLRPCGLDDAPVGFLLEGEGEFDALGREIAEAVARRFWR
jgi:lipoate-protein ligase B